MIHLKRFFLLFITGLLAACGTETAETPTAPVPPTTEPPTAEPTVLPTTATEAIEIKPTTSEPTALPSAAPTPSSADDMAFTFYSQNPVIRPVTADDGGIRFIAPGAVFEQDGRLHMFRGGFLNWPGDSEVAYYTSNDGYTWNRQQAAPVLRSDAVPFAEPGTMGHTGFVDDNGQWALYFHTFKGTNSPGYIGRATAPDPLGPWTADSEPVLFPGSEGEWDDLRFVRPQVIRTQEGFVMYYAAFSEDGRSMIGRATSADGVVWNKYDDPATIAVPFAESDPVLQPDEEWTSNGLNRPAVAHTPEGWVMLYQSGADYGIAFSDDGVRWQPYEGNPILRAGEMAANIGRSNITLYQAALAYFEGTYFLFVEAGGSGGADIYLLTHEGMLLDNGLETAEEETEEEIAVDPMGPVVVETLVEEIASATGGLTVDAAGNIYVADIGAVPSRLGETVYKITPEGEVSVFATGGGMLGASGNVFDSQGNLYQSNFTANSISKITPDGEVTEFTSLGLFGPVGLTIDEENNLFVANCIGNSVQMVTAEGKTTQFATSSLFNCPNGITMDEEHNLYVVNFSNGLVLKVTPDAEVSELVRLPGNNNGHIIYAGQGILYAVARGAHSIYRISTSGQFDLVAGTGERGNADGPGTEASFSLPNGIGISPDGTKLYINQVLSTTGSDNHPITVRVIHIGG